MKRTFFGLLSIAIILLCSIQAQAQLHVGAGAKFQNEVPYFTVLLAVNNNIAELAWGTQSLRVNEPGLQLNTTTDIFSPLVKIFLALDSPITPFLGLGGISLSTEVEGHFKGKSVHVMLKKEGAQAALGLSYHAEDYPVIFSAGVNYSTIEAEIPLDFIIQDNVETLMLPFPGVSGWGWSIDARFTFELEPAIDKLFEWIRGGIRSNQSSDEPESDA